jgi:hypothetical protein
MARYLQAGRGSWHIGLLRARKGEWEARAGQPPLPPGLDVEHQRRLHDLAAAALHYSEGPALGGAAAADAAGREAARAEGSGGVVVVDGIRHESHQAGPARHPPAEAPTPSRWSLRPRAWPSASRGTRPSGTTTAPRGWKTGQRKQPPRARPGGCRNRLGSVPGRAPASNAGPGPAAGGRHSSCYRRLL